MAPRNRKRKREPSADIDEASGEQVAEVPDARASVKPAENGADDELDEQSKKEQDIWDAFREEHHEAVEQLPLSLHRTFTLIRDLDAQSQAFQSEIPSLFKEYIRLRRQLQSLPLGQEQQQGESSSTSDPAAARRSSREIITRLAVALEDWVRVSDEKMNLAQSAYNSTDRYVRILDKDISEQEGTAGEPSAGLDDPNALEISSRKEGPGLSNLHRRIRGRRKSVRRPPGHNTQRARPPTAPGEASEEPSPNRPPNAINMAVMPNEPLYCYCNQVSHGLMVACDNKNCLREWFHYQCVGLREEPKEGKPWYCPDCAEILKRNSRRRRR